MVKALFFDIDGTLVSFRTHRISPAVLDALHTLRRKGIKLCISTGRHPCMLNEIREVFPFDGYITLSGQYCYCQEQILRRSPMSKESVSELVAAVQNNAFSCIFLEEHDIYINYADEYTAQFVQQLKLPLPPIAPPSRALGRDIYQAITFLTRKNEHLLLERAPHLKTTRWHPNFLDIIPTGGGKDKGMDTLLSYFGIPVEDSMAFGDGENDLSMLVHAGTGIAMGSASAAVKAQSDYVTGTVDEDGILSALMHFGLL